MLTGELDTLPIVKEILNSGKTIFVPEIDVGVERKDGLFTSLRPRRFAIIACGHMGNQRAWGGIQRCETDKCTRPPSESDMILVPGVAFDRSMVKFGHGKGYYDRYITSYNATGPASFACALALREQLLDNATSTNGLVLKGEYDWTMDIIITPDEVLHVNSTKD
ncbi:nagb/rpia/CoA transferase-like protein [Dendrothele bispora CBS 962.96]|uniref:5-formyltetrahydrofolate cyclo-ligase n=1 Tax=Dendrothele bispora (strain CBS 962.96) TaxID=1314807 RepID=A0A4S8KSR1_DENBC|nr:nagb/rpia/CoA transferase-like protein [Dendrothele bispora CBS 962.96]